MKKILIIGSPGSGKSTLAKQISEKLNLPLVHLDKLFWKENWQKSSNEEFDERLLCELKKDCWIIEGNFSRTLPLRLEYCTEVILLNYPAITCIARVLKRVIKNRGKTRSDMADNCPEFLDFEFLKYVGNFKKTGLKKIRTALSKSDVPVIEIKNNRQLKNYLKNL